jgi:hypothetical protein
LPHGRGARCPVGGRGLRMRRQERGLLRPAERRRRPAAAADAAARAAHAPLRWLSVSNDCVAARQQRGPGTYALHAAAGKRPCMSAREALQ